MTMTKADLAIQREEEKLAALQQKIKDQQKRITKAKEKKEKEIETDQKKIGQAITDCFPELLNLMHRDGFNIYDFVKSNEFQQAFYLTYIVGHPQNAPKWTRGEWEDPDEEDFEDDEPEFDESAVQNDEPELLEPEPGTNAYFM